MKWHLGKRADSKVFVYGENGEEIADCDMGFNRHEENVQHAKLIIAAPDMHKTLVEVESALGENLMWLYAALDLRLRQGDKETIERLARIEAAWSAVCKTLGGVKI